MIALLLAIIPYSPVIETQVDLYEYNRIYSDDGTVALTQRIFHDIPEVLGWRMVKRPDCRLDSNRVLFFDGDVLRLIRYGSRVDSHTNYDPEMDARQVLSPEHRRELGAKP
jgi:hypothetical protein